MKINVEFEMTPEEFRKAIGLPDVELFNDTAISQMQQVFKNGAVGLEEFLNPVINQSFENISMMRNLMLQALAGSDNSKDKGTTKDNKTKISLNQKNESSEEINIKPKPSTAVKNKKS